MAGLIYLDYGTNGQVITCTLASLGNGSAQGSAAVNNSAAVGGNGGYEDALVQLTLKTGASGVTAVGLVNVYAVASTDGGTTYGENAGSNASVTLTVPTNARLIGSINAVANATTYKSNPMSVAAAFGGTMPQYWALIVQNETGGALDSTAGSFVLQYQGVYHQYT
jgi:hypothetical protein